MQLKLLPEVVIKYDLRSKDLGYNVSYYCNMNIVTQSCYIIKLGMYDGWRVVDDYYGQAVGKLERIVWAPRGGGVNRCYSNFNSFSI
jgi:hypothetical protein